MVEALHFVHQKQMIHRDLKPSNIFLRDDSSIAVGDFGVPTVMKHIRTMTRTAVGMCIHFSLINMTTILPFLTQDL